MALHWKKPPLKRRADLLETTSACPLSSSGIPKYSEEPVRNSQAWPKEIVVCLACYNFMESQEVRPNHRMRS
jgi:hypothetical protein